MTPEQATDLAARTLTAIDADKCDRCWHCARNREDHRKRVASDLAGLRQHVQFDDFAFCKWCKYDTWPCPDAARYADGLKRTAALYGVTPLDCDGTVVP